MGCFVKPPSRRGFTEGVVLQDHHIKGRFSLGTEITKTTGWFQGTQWFRDILLFTCF